MLQARWEKLKEILKQGYINFLPNQILLDSRLHASSIKVYALLSAASFSTKFTCFYSQKLLAYLGDLSVKTISRAIKELKLAGYINVQYRKGETCIYTLVHKFAQTVTNNIKNKNESKKEEAKNSFTKNKKNKGFDKKEKPNTFNNFEQRSYDFDSLEKQLLGWETPKENQFGEIFQQALLL